MKTVITNPTRHAMFDHFYDLEVKQGIKVFLTPDGVSWLLGTFHEDKKKQAKKVVEASNGGKKILFGAKAV